MAARDQPTGTFRYGAADEPDEDRTQRADQDDPAPAFKAEGVARYQRPSQQGDYGNHAELYDLVHSEGAASKMFGHEFGDVGVNSHQLNADADAGDHAPGDDANRCVLEGHDDGGSRVPQQRAGENHAPPEPVRREPKSMVPMKRPAKVAATKLARPLNPKNDAEDLENRPLRTRPGPI